MDSSLIRSSPMVTALAVAVSGVEPDAGVQALWSRLESSITRRGGAITGCVESCLEAIFITQEGGAANSDSADAVEAALEMLRESHTAGVVVSLRAGIHHGKEEDRDAVQQLARTLRDGSLPGQIWVSEAVYHHTRGLVDVQIIDASAKQGERVFRVWGMRPRPFRFAPHIGASLLVGRDPEMAFLHTAFDQVIEEGKLRFITVVGPAGMGKSRLLNEFLRRLDEENHPFILFRGRADPTAGSRPHTLLRDLLAFRFKILESDPPEIARAKLVGGVQDWIGQDAVEAAHWMGQLAGFDFSDSPYLHDQLEDTGRARLKALSMMRKFLSAVAAHTPVLILLDNVQWADDGSLDGLEALARLKPTGPILIVAQARPELLERRPRWGDCTPSHCLLALSPLQHDETAAMASQTLRSALGQRRGGPPGPGAFHASADLITLPARLIDRIVEASGGNPYFVEELVKNYIETGILVAEGEVGATTWRIDMTRLASAQIPGSLDDALLAHFDVLTPFTRAVIYRAAVIGQVFWDHAVQLLLERLDLGDTTGSGAEDLSTALRALQAHGLILRRDHSVIAGAAEYLFRSPQLHAVAYASSPPGLRVRGHELAGDWLAEHTSGREDVYAASIAGHYDLGSAPVRAAEWYARAGLMARSVAAPEAAARFFLRALDTLPEGEKHLPRRFELYGHLWDVQWWQSQFGAALSTARDLLAEAETYADIAAQAAAWNRMAAVYNRMGEPKPALQSVQRAERLARQVGATGEVVKALFNRGVTLDQLGHSVEALEAGQQALAFNQSMLEQGIDSEAIHETSRILTLMGAIHQRAGRFERAGETFSRLLEIAQARGDALGAISALIHLGENGGMQGDYHSAEAAYQDALERAKAGAFHDQALICLDALAGAHAELGAYRQAEEELREVKQQSNGLHWLLLPAFYHHRALAHLGDGQLLEALQDALRALDHAREANASEQVGQAWRILGRVLAQGEGGATEVDDKLCDVHTCYAASMQIFVELGLPGEQARTLRSWATYELEQGDRREGLRMWKEARDTFAGLGMKAEVERMERVTQAPAASAAPPPVHRR